MVVLLLGGTKINYVGHRGFIRNVSDGSTKEMKRKYMSGMGRWKEEVGVQESNRLHMETSNGDWLTIIYHRLNGTELS